MNVNELAELVCQMREWQQAYFKTRSNDALSKAKELERRVDAEVKRILDCQKELF